MATETSYTSLRDNLSSVLDRVFEDQEIVIVRRKGARDVALVPAGELAGLLETAHLLRSPKNARRLEGFDGKLLSLYARGMTTREIQGHLEELYGTEVSPQLFQSI